MMDPTGEGEESMSDDEGVEIIEFEPDTKWVTDDSCQRWMVIDGLK